MSKVWLVTGSASGSGRPIQRQSGNSALRLASWRSPSQAGGPRYGGNWFSSPSVARSGMGTGRRYGKDSRDKTYGGERRRHSD